MLLWPKDRPAALGLHEDQLKAGEASGPARASTGYYRACWGMQRAPAPASAPALRRHQSRS